MTTGAQLNYSSHRPASFKQPQFRFWGFFSRLFIFSANIKMNRRLYANFFPIGKWQNSKMYSPTFEKKESGRQNVISALRKSLSFTWRVH